MSGFSAADPGRAVVALSWCAGLQRTAPIASHFAEQVDAPHAAIMADFGEPADPDLPLAPDWRDLA